MNTILPFGFHSPQTNQDAAAAGKLLTLARERYHPATRSWKEDELYETANGKQVGLCLAWNRRDELRGTVRMQLEGWVRCAPRDPALPARIEIPEPVVAHLLPELTRWERSQIYCLLLEFRLRELCRGMQPVRCELPPRAYEFAKRIVTIRRMIVRLGRGRLPGDCDEEE